MRSLVGTVLAVLVCGSLCSCAVTSAKFVEGASGYSNTRGRVADFEDLHSREIRHLSDGLAITVGEGGCQITMEFEDDQKKRFPMGPGSIVVFGADADFILTPLLEE